jgi:hypothetical protein
MRFLPILVLVAGCGASRPGPEVPAGEQAFDDLSRDELNLLALRLDLPLFWAADADGDRSVDAGEVRELLFYPSEGRWVSDGELTPQFVAAYDAMVRAKSAPPPESVRERLLLHELGTAAIAVVETDLRSLPEEHRQFAERMLAVARLIDALYAKQVGMAALAARLEGASAPSRSVFRRNWGPECLSPAMERNTACSAIEGAPKRYVDVYPETLQRQDGFCAAIEARPDGEALLDPFVAVRERNGAPVPVPYHEVYGAEMTAIAAELDAAAGALADPNEESLRVYLRAAAASFRSNDWLAADEAWSRMNAESSRWYLRVAPDETYWDPCSRKAGFHLTLALVDRASLEWQRLLTPFQDDMERAIASLNERVYTARDVSFHMPDFIAIAINAGDDRTAFGATIGQSLPNWGRVADEGWRRTVAMANLYTDADSEARRRQVAESLFTTGSLAHYSASSEPGLMSTVLHEATHNLGPSHDHRLNGRDDARRAQGADRRALLPRVPRGPRRDHARARERDVPRLVDLGARARVGGHVHRGRPAQTVQPALGRADRLAPRARRADVRRRPACGERARQGLVRDRPRATPRGLRRPHARGDPDHGDAGSPGRRVARRALRRRHHRAARRGLRALRPHPPPELRLLLRTLTVEGPASLRNMPSLTPCTQCDRHVRSSDPTCPFCGAAAPAPRAPRRAGRISRAAFFAGAVAAAACSDSRDPPRDSGPRVDSARVDAARPDAARADAARGDGGRDAGEDAGDIPMPYGAPPRRARLA